MGDGIAAMAISIFASRLRTLTALLDKAYAQWTGEGRDVAELVAARLTGDMHPFAYQIVFTCNQPNEFLAWCRGETHEQPDPAALDWRALRAHVAQTLAAVESAAVTGLRAPDPVKRIELRPLNAHLVLSEERYVDDWLMPNFYFHLVTSYGLLRLSGIEIGKADYMAHLAGDVRPNG